MSDNIKLKTDRISNLMNCFPGIEPPSDDEYRNPLILSGQQLIWGLERIKQDSSFVCLDKFYQIKDYEISEYKGLIMDVIE